jgi:hypothetical protein
MYPRLPGFTAESATAPSAPASYRSAHRAGTGLTASGVALQIWPRAEPSGKEPCDPTCLCGTAKGCPCCPTVPSTRPKVNRW